MYVCVCVCVWERDEINNIRSLQSSIFQIFDIIISQNAKD